MSTLTIRIPDAKYERLKNYAKSKKISLNKLFDELATIALTQYDVKTKEPSEKPLISLKQVLFFASRTQKNFIKKSKRKRPFGVECSFLALRLT